VPLRQWVLTVPFVAKPPGFDGALLGAVVRRFADAVLAFYKRRLAGEGALHAGEGGPRAVIARSR
jgi:hypothetical protein